MRLYQILRESEDYSFHNMVAVARNQLDDYARRIKLAASKHQLMPSEIENMERGIRNIGYQLDTLTDPENDYFNQNPQKRYETLEWATQNLPKYEQLLAELPDASKPATAVAKAIAIWLSYMHEMANMSRFVSLDKNHPDRAKQEAIFAQLRRANALARTGHPWQALFAGIQAHIMSKARDEQRRNLSIFRPEV